MPGLTFSSKLDLGPYIIYIAKKFLSPEAALYLYKSTTRPCMEYYYHVWADAPSCYLELLDKVQKQMFRTVGPSLVACGEPLAHP